MVARVNFTGGAVMNAIFNPGKSVMLDRVELHMDATGGAAENFTITKNSIDGVVYDVVYLTQAMAAVSDVVYMPDRPLFLNDGDSLVFAYTNTNSRVWGLSIFFNPL